MTKSLDAACALVFADPAGMQCVMVVTIKVKSLRIIGVYAHNDHAAGSELFRRIEPFFDDISSGSFSGRLEYPK